MWRTGTSLSACSPLCVPTPAQSLEPQDRVSLLCPDPAHGSNRTADAMAVALGQANEAVLVAARNGSRALGAGECLPRDGFIFTTEGHPVPLARLRAGAAAARSEDQSKVPPAPPAAGMGRLRMAKARAMESPA